MIQNPYRLADHNETVVKFPINVNINPNYLTLMFIYLKLVGHIDWSWWWVLSPTLIPLSVFIVWIILWVAVNVNRR